MSFKTADLCDDYPERLSVLKPGFISYGDQQIFAGPVSTVRCYEDNSMVRRQLELSGNGRVLVVDAGHSLRCAMLGDLLAAMAIDNGWSGVIMNGLIRDSADISQMPLGVMALGTHPKKSEKKNSGDIDVSIDIAGVEIIPGDWVYADRDGIVFSHSKLPIDL